MQRKAQAAMEFLMTYGWAILVVLAAIGALAYFGVLSPDKFLPERCTGPAGMDCIDKAVISASADTVEFALRNNNGYTINVTSTATGTDNCAAASAITIDGVAVTGTGISVANNVLFRVKVTCGDIVAGRFKSDITMNYINTETGLSHPAAVSIRGKAS